MREDDTFFQELRSDWQHDTVNRATILRGYTAYRQSHRRATIVNIVGSASILTGFIGLTSLALARADATYAVAAAAFALSLPLVLSQTIRTLRSPPERYDQNTLGLLRQTQNHIASVRVTLKNTRHCAMILVLATLALCAATAWGISPLRDTLPLSILWTATAAGLWLWQYQRGRRLQTEAARIETLLEDFDRADTR